MEYHPINLFCFLFSQEFILEQVFTIYIFRDRHNTIFISRELMITSMVVVCEIFPEAFII
jgi:hypothetical protein